MVCALKHNRERTKVKRVQVTFTEDQWKLIEKFRGIMGSDDAEIVRSIVLSWLSEKSIVSSAVKGSDSSGEGK